MQVIIRGENIKVTDGLQEYAEKKLGKLDRYMPNISEIHVEIERQNAKRGGVTTSAQITLRHARGAILRAEEKLTGDDRQTAHAAINIAVDKMYRQIERFKGKKRRNRRGNERFFATIEELETVEDIPEDEYAEYEEVEELEDFDDIVRRKDVPVTPMTELEAIDQMELLGHKFFMFFNSDTNSVNVLYRRDEGGYGVLIPNVT